MKKSVMERALENPCIVGVHYFSYQDQPISARWLDRENYAIGFIDIADTPDMELCRSSRRIGERAVAIRLKSGCIPITGAHGDD